jgi:hypothetical protein
LDKRVLYATNDHDLRATERAVTSPELIDQLADGRFTSLRVGVEVKDKL